MATSDSLGTLFPINVVFVKGEQPSGDKFTGWASQTDNALRNVASAIGDLWTVDSNLKAFSVQSLYNTERYSHVTNLARIIGPGSMLNPIRPYNITITGYSSGSLPNGKHEISLLDDANTYPPFDWNFANHLFNGIDGSLATSLNSANSSVFTTEKTSIRDLTASGDYYIDNWGRVYSYDTLPSSTTLSSLNTDLVPDFYPGATMNVIPDLNNVGLQPGSFGITGSGPYTIDLSSIVLTFFNLYDEAGNHLAPGDTLCSPQPFSPTLPEYFADLFNTNDTITDGLVRLWDKTDKRYVEGATFKYQDQQTLTIEDVTLDSGHEYYLVVAGSTLTELVANLNRRFEMHRHDSPLYGGRPIRHSDLSGNLADINEPTYGIAAKFGINMRNPPSTIIGNDHPQYLLRTGWKSGVDSGNQDNAILGDLFLARYDTDYYNNDYKGLSESSRKIMFSYSTQYLFFTGLHFAFSHDLRINERGLLRSYLYMYTGNNALVYDANADKQAFAFLDSGYVSSSKLFVGHNITTNENDIFDISPLPDNKTYIISYIDANETPTVLLKSKEENRALKISVDGTNGAGYRNVYVDSSAGGINCDLEIKGGNKLKLTTNYVNGTIEIDRDIIVTEGKSIKTSDGTPSLQFNSSSITIGGGVTMSSLGVDTNVSLATNGDHVYTVDCSNARYFVMPVRNELPNGTFPQGAMIFNNDIGENKPYYWNGSAWVAF